jgi:(p)ppGpp synthase/HD superfamily hydrolase
MEPQTGGRLDRYQTSRSGTREGETVASHDTPSLVPGDALGAGTPGRRLLALMSLHAITSVYGQDGLHERLLIEAERFSAADRARIGAALELMYRLHERDRRQREPYACHPLRVTIRILAHYRVTDADVACAALLHDTVEDHAGDIAPGGGPDAAVTILGGQFGERAAGLVAAVTNPIFEPGRDQHEQYRRHVTASLEASPWARVIKVSDFTDNAVMGRLSQAAEETILAVRQRRVTDVSTGPSHG